MELGSSRASGNVGFVDASPSPPGLIELVVVGMRGMEALESGAYVKGAVTVTSDDPASPTFL
jgi:hypothetical protein